MMNLLTSVDEGIEAARWEGYLPVVMKEWKPGENDYLHVVMEKWKLDEEGYIRGDRRMEASEGRLLTCGDGGMEAK